MEDIIGLIASAGIVAIPVMLYLRREQRREARARSSAEKGRFFSEGPRAQHPRIDVLKCIGCGSCADACPEGDVLAVYAGKAAIVSGHRCIGHGLCTDACPVGAIEMVMAPPCIGADMPRLTPEGETNIRNLFIIGELGGLALIKNAVNQGRDCADTIAKRLPSMHANHSASEVYDVCIVGAGPAGISASLRAIEHGLSYITLEQDEIGGAVAKYPRQKLVLTSPVEFPVYGKFLKTEISKEELLFFWNKIFQRADFKVKTAEGVENIEKNETGIFAVRTSRGLYYARTVVLALGRRGTPRKLGIRGEELPKVMYSLIEAEAYTNRKIVVVGGGDSAIEAALGLARQRGNEVTLSYRQDALNRIKERNARRIHDCIRSGRIRVLYNSNPVEIRETSVLLEVSGEIQEIANDYVWIFAGGTPPNAFLEKIGVELRNRDLTPDAGRQLATASG